MRFAVENLFATTLARFEALLDDPELYPRLERALPRIERIELLSSEESDGVQRRRVRYTPRYDERLRGRIAHEHLVWVEVSELVRAEHRIEYRVEPGLPPRWRDRLISHGTFRFRETDAGVVRAVEGEVVVRVPVLGPRIERALVGGMLEGFQADAGALSAWLAERHGVTG